MAKYGKVWVGIGKNRLRYEKVLECTKMYEKVWESIGRYGKVWEIMGRYGKI